MRVNKQDQETIIVFNAYDDYAEVYTRELRIMELLARRAEKHPEHYELLWQGDGYVTYKVWKTLVRFRPPETQRTYTPETKARLAEGARIAAAELKRVREQQRKLKERKEAFKEGRIIDG